METHFFEGPGVSPTQGTIVFYVVIAANASASAGGTPSIRATVQPTSSCVSNEQFSGSETDSQPIRSPLAI